MKLSRLLWLLCPLLAVAVASAPEWPSRAQMLQTPLRDVVLPMANRWADVSRPWKAQQAAPAALPESTVVTAKPASPAAINPASSVVSNPSPVTKEQLAKAAQDGVDAAMASSSAHSSTSSPMPAPAAVQAASGTVLLLGDSLMGEVARGLRQGLPRAFSLVDKHRSSTGLTNNGYYDWPSEAGVFTAQVQPDWVVIHLGGNDGQDMLIGGRWVGFGSAQWEAQYQVRAQALIDNVRTQSPAATIIWLGLPAMRSPKFDAKMSTIARLQAAAATSRGIAYIDGRAVLGNTYAKDGQGRDGRRHVWRAEDGIHYSREGGYRLAEEVGTFPSVDWPWGRRQ